MLELMDWVSLGLQLSGKGLILTKASPVVVAFLLLPSLVGSLLFNESWFHAIAVPSGGFVTVQGLCASEAAIPDWATGQKW